MNEAVLEARLRQVLSAQLREMSRNDPGRDIIEETRRVLALKEALVILNPLLAEHWRPANLIDGQHINSTTYSEFGSIECLSETLSPLGLAKAMRIGGQGPRSLITSTARPVPTVGGPFTDGKFVFYLKCATVSTVPSFPLVSLGEIQDGDLLPFMVRLAGGQWLLPTNIVGGQAPQALPLGFNVNSGFATDTSWRINVEVVNPIKINNCMLSVRFRTGTIVRSTVQIPIPQHSLGVVNTVINNGALVTGQCDNVILVAETWDAGNELKSFEMTNTQDLCVATMKVGLTVGGQVLSQYPVSAGSTATFCAVADAQSYAELKQYNLEHRDHVIHADLSVFSNFSTNINKGGTETTVVTYDPLSFNLQESVLSAAHLPDGNSDARKGASHHFVPTDEMLVMSSQGSAQGDKRQCLLSVFITGQSVGNSFRYKRFLLTHLSTLARFLSPYKNEPYSPAMSDARLLLRSHAGHMAHTNSGHIEIVQDWWKTTGYPLFKRIGKGALNVGLDVLAGGAAAVIAGL